MRSVIVRVLLGVAIVMAAWSVGRAQTPIANFEMTLWLPNGDTKIECHRGCDFQENVGDTSRSPRPNTSFVYHCDGPKGAPCTININGNGRVMRDVYSELTTTPGLSDLEKKALDVAQHVSMKALDKSLADMRFTDWFKALVGESSEVVWHVSDCGEGDGRPDSAGRDLPICGEVVVNLTRTKKAIVELIVGSRSKGVRSAALWSAAILDGNDVKFFKTLPELAVAIRAK